MRKKVVMAFGTFDILHPGHLHYLSKAKALGDTLIVVVSRDRSAASAKGRRPAMNERERLRIVSSLKVVDAAVLGNRSSGRDWKFRIIKRYRPDIIALGYDQRVRPNDLELFLKRNRIAADVVRIRNSYRPTHSKSSLIKKRILAPD
jgi:FAD synthetase